MSVDLPNEELFVGQVIALLPTSAGDAPLGEESAAQEALAGAAPEGETPPTRVRKRTYSVITEAPDRGVFLIGRTEIEVSIRPLDVDTPLEAAVFRIAAISGRALRVTRMVATSPQPGT